MKERPILFSGPMVQALLSGRKTQTRRVCKIQVVQVPEGMREEDIYLTARLQYLAMTSCPYGKVGDRLYVRESFRFINEGTHGAIGYEADGLIRLMPSAPTADDDPHAWWVVGRDRHGEKLRPGIFLPKWASRLTLEITEVRVQRLNEISIADIAREGVIPPNDGFTCDKDWAMGEWRKVWESINGKGSWERNPFVWAISFTPIEVPNVASRIPTKETSQ